MEEREELHQLRHIIIERIQHAMTKGNEYRSTFEQYCYLWIDDMQEFMRQFVLFGHVLTSDELAGTTEDQVPRKPPTLEQYREQIDLYEKLYAEVEKIESSMVIDQWFRIDIKFFKSALLNIIKKWSLLFKNHLLEEIINALTELDEFIKDRDKGLGKTVPEGDLEGLIQMMGHLMAVKEKQPTYDNTFEPVKQKIELLKSFQVEVPDDVFDRLQELPEKWNNTKKNATLKKQEVAPLQNNEVNNVRKRAGNFDVQQHSFREKFRMIPPFRYLFHSVPIQCTYGYLFIVHVRLYMYM